MINDFWLEHSDIIDIDEEVHDEAKSEILAEVASSQLPPPFPLSHEQLLSAHKEVHVPNSNTVLTLMYNLLETFLVFGTN